MEHILLIDNYDSCLMQNDFDEVNRWLKNGWKVKSLTIHHTKDRIFAFIVLEQ